MLSPFSWFIIIYVSLGTYIMMEAVVESWAWEEYETWIKVIGGIVCVLVWPIIFFI